MPINPSRFFSKLILICLYVLGLYISLKVTLHSFPIDPDGIQSLIIWNGMNQDGFSWITSWVATQDNWLLSLVIIHFLEFWVFGPNPFLPIFTGWVIFVLAAFMSGLIALELKAKHAAYLIPLLLLFTNLYGHQFGLVSYAMSHNITNLWGLIGLFVFIRWIRTKSWLSCWMIFFIHLISSFSDPWMLPAYTIPTFFVACLLFKLKDSNLNQRKQLGFLIISLALCFMIRSTLFFGLLDFLTPTQFTLDTYDIAKTHCVALIQNLGAFFNLWPGVSENLFLPNFFSFLIIGFLLAISIYLVISHFFSRTFSHSEIILSSPFKQPIFIFLCIVFLSVSSVSASFIISLWRPLHPEYGWLYEGRFIINIFYLVTLSLGILFDLYWRQLSQIFKLLIYVLMGLFIIASLWSNWPLIKTSQAAIQNAQLRQFIQYLHQENLHYGYGTLWGASARTLTIFDENSSDPLKIRPVYFDSLSGKISFIPPGETSQKWYSPQDWRKDQKYFFVIINYPVTQTDFLNGLACQNMAFCLNSLTTQFGKPVKVLIYPALMPSLPPKAYLAKTPTPPFIIAVWNHPLINWYSQEPLKINLGQVIPFNASYSSHIPSWQGWSEPDLTGTWSVGKTAVLNLALNHTSSINQDLKLFIVGQTCLTTLHPKQEVDVWVNHQYLTTWVYTPEKNDGVRTVILPKALVETSHGNLTIKFSFHQAISPAEVGYSDKRNLGMLLRFIEVVPVTPAH